MKYVSMVIVVGLVALFSSCFKSIDTSQAQQFMSDTTSIVNYLVQNNIYAIKLPAGIWYVIDSGGENGGIRATYSDTVSVTYTMSVMASNSIVDQQTAPVDFNLSGLVTGVQTAMPYFPKGSRGRIFIPSYFGYGTSAYGSIPANSNLIFDFNLKNVKDYHLKADTTTIDAYLASKNITTAVHDPSGLRYTIDTLDIDGFNATGGTVVAANYGLYLLSGGNLIEEVAFTSTPAQTAFYNLPLVWQIVLSQVPSGSYITIYVPSSLGSGPNVYSGIPAYSILVYKIKFLSII